MQRNSYIKKSTIEKVLLIMEEIGLPGYEDKTPHQIAKEHSTSPNFILQMIKMGLVNKGDLRGLTWVPDIKPDADLALRVIQATYNSKATKEAPAPPPPNLIPFDEAVKFAGEVIFLAKVFNIEPDSIPEFLQEIASLFKKYSK